MAWYSERTPISQLFKNEDVNSIGSIPDEPWNRPELL